ncbi:MAG: NAD(P)-dependent oxidoreductase [Candidatus Bathyarchaeia archaeon]
MRGIVLFYVLVQKEFSQFIPNMLGDIAKVNVTPYIADEEELISIVRSADAIVGRYKITKRVIEAAEKLRIVALHGHGLPDASEMDWIDAATKKGIFVTRSPAAQHISVAEHCIAMMLALVKKLVVADREVRKGRWSSGAEELYCRTHEITGKTIGIIGFGNIGSTLAQMLKSFNVNLLAFDPYTKNRQNVRLVSLETLLKQSDFICVTCPLTDETKGLIGEKEFKIMKKNAYLINVSRGPIVNEKALLKALKEGWIAGAGLDVFDPEPPAPDNPLFNLDNCVFSPHVAGLTEEGCRRSQEIIANDIRSVLLGGLPKLENLLNPELIDPSRSRPRW